MKIKFHVSGMTCAACSARVEKAAIKVSGVQSVDVNLLSGTMMVEMDDLSVSGGIQRIHTRQNES